MASTYEYTNVEELENKTAKNYHATDSRFTDEVIEQNITEAEKLVNSICGESFSDPIPDAVNVATLKIAAVLMDNLLIAHGYGNEGETRHPVLNIVEIKEILQEYVSDQEDLVFSIPMQGIDRY